MKPHASLLLSLLVLFRADPAEAQQPGRPELPVRRAVEPPKIDGVLDDRAWIDSKLPLGEWRSYNPVRGDKPPVAFDTEVHLTFDDRNLYFAFHCIDPEPGNIRTTISRRDSVFSDDWVGLSLDSAGTAQSSYHLMINPDGVQMDAINTPANGEQFEADFVWESAGKVTADGYVVEIALPLQSIRFGGGAGVRMGILFWRHISRSGVSYASPDLPPGQWVFDRHAHLVFDQLKQPRLFELLPSVTAPVSQTRATSDRWNPASARGNVGLSSKYGITSNITLDATINPDFSQVESDAFQVTVNQRFPVYFSEKRPFFMEGMGLFNIAGAGGDGNMRTAVHTRRIIDPSWGAKVTGTTGKLTFGLLNSSDEHPEDIGSGGTVDNRNTAFTIARATYGLGGPSYVGVIATDTEHPDGHNRVVGSDLSFRFTPTQQMSATVLASQTGRELQQSALDMHGSASQVTYSYNTRRISSSNQLEHYDRDFQMDTAFYNRTGFTAGWSYFDLNFYPAGKNRLGVQRVFPYFQGKAGYDEVQEGSERSVLFGVGVNLTRQSSMRVSFRRGKEPWAGQRFDSGEAHVEGGTQLYRWLQVFGAFSRGPATYYDPINPFQGRSTSTHVGITLQPNAHFNQEVTYDSVLFDRPADDSRVFTAHILYTRTTYQFNRHFLVRGIEQFDSSTQRLLTDLLASYELIPGSVVHAGYGSSFDRVSYQDGVWIPNTGRYLTTSRGLFFKVSYLFRL